VPPGTETGITSSNDQTHPPEDRFMTALRGHALSSHSYESDSNVVPLDAVPHAYHCPAGHVTTLAFHPEAEEIPETWDCPRCGRHAHLDETAARRLAGSEEGLALVSPRSSAAGKTHRDMLLERRTTDELEELLIERLQLLRTGER
jgi:hypothetical protein